MDLVTAESCTGGGVATAITRISGSAKWFECGFVTYGNVAKKEMLGVSQRTLGDHGAVSEEVAREMAAGALRRSHADVSVSVTGIAGPTGGSRKKPVGLVFFAWGEIYSLFPATVTDTFGARYATTNTGLMYTAKGTASLLVPLANVLTAASGGSWVPVFYTAAVMNIVAAVMALALLKPMRSIYTSRSAPVDAHVKLAT